MNHQSAIYDSVTPFVIRNLRKLSKAFSNLPKPETIKPFAVKAMASMPGSHTLRLWLQDPTNADPFKDLKDLFATYWVGL